MPPDPSGAPWRSRWLPVLSGAILAFGSPPISIPILPFIGLVPLMLWIDRPLSAREMHRGGWAFALPYILGQAWWIFALVRFTPVALIASLGAVLIQVATYFLFPIGVNLLRRTRPGIPLVLAAPALWVVSEHARAWGDLSLPFISIGYALSEWPFLLQHADLVGVHGVTAWLVAVNAALAALVAGRRRGGFGRRVALVAALLALPLGYDAWRWLQVGREIAAAPTLRVAIVQPNVEQDLKFDPRRIPEQIARMNRLIGLAEGSGVAFIVAPESSLPAIIPADAARLPDGIAAGATPLLVGGIAGIGEGVPRRFGDVQIEIFRDHYNSAFLAAPDRSVVARYDKQVLIPVGEKIPFEPVLGPLLAPFWSRLGRLKPAAGLTLLDLPRREGPVRFGALICYEAMFPALVRRTHDAGAAFLVNLTNDAWFGRTSFAAQHAGLCALRAIENRASIVRAANTGISGFYDPLGRCAGRTGLFEEAVTVHSIPLLIEETPYDRWGDVVLWLAYAGTLALLVAAWTGRAPRPPVVAEPAGTELAGTELPGPERAGTELSGTEQPGTEPGTEPPGPDPAEPGGEGYTPSE